MVQDSPKGAVLTVHVLPKAARTEYVGVHGDALKIRVAAPPVDGAANDSLCAYLAARLDISQSSVAILAGQTGRRKRVLLKGVSRRQVSLVFPGT
jgi:uncharacterized protein (TIGR00251 family)